MTSGPGSLSKADTTRSNPNKGDPTPMVGGRADGCTRGKLLIHPPDLISNYLVIVSLLFNGARKMLKNRDNGLLSPTELKKLLAYVWDKLASDIEGNTIASVP